MTLNHIKKFFTFGTKIFKKNHMFHVYIAMKKDLDSKSRVEDVAPIMCLVLTFVISTSLMPRRDTTSHT